MVCDFAVQRFLNRCEPRPVGTQGYESGSGCEVGQARDTGGQLRTLLKESLKGKQSAEPRCGGEREGLGRGMGLLTDRD